MSQRCWRLREACFVAMLNTEIFKKKQQQQIKCLKFFSIDCSLNNCIMFFLKFQFRCQQSISSSREEVTDRSEYQALFTLNVCVCVKHQEWVLWQQVMGVYT